MAENRSNFLNTRMNRATYFALLGLMLVLLGLVFVFSRSPPHVSEVVLMFIWIPRLHDIGRTGWWVALVLAAEIAILVGALAILPTPIAMEVMGAFVLVVLGLMVWLGAVPGDSGPNRFGDPPPPGLRLKAKTAPDR